MKESADDEHREPKQHSTEPSSQTDSDPDIRQSPQFKHDRTEEMK